MPDRSEPEDRTAREVVDESRDHVLALTDAGWGVWKKSDPSGEPMVLFSPDDEGFELASDYFERAKRAGRSLKIAWFDVLRWSAIVSGGVWIIATIAAYLRQYILQNPFTGFSGSGDVFILAMGPGPQPDRVSGVPGLRRHVRASLAA